MADLRQILSQGRKRIALLVGAGAPLAIKVGGDGKLADSGQPLIPGVDDLTKEAISALEGINHAAATAIMSDLGTGANIEAVLSHVRLLEKALGNVEMRGLNAEGYRSLGEDICKNIGKIVSARLPAGQSGYSELVSWVSGTLRAHAVEIFTTNYDLLFEEAFERVKAPYFDGFTGGHAPFFDPVTVAGDDLPPRWSRLWKLHGSIGWKLEGGAVVRGQERGATHLVYPDHLKYDLTQKQPYAALFERLKQFLLTPDTLLLAIGFSFRDAHVCAILDEALAMNANCAVFAFQFGNLDNEQAACRLAYDRPNLSVYAADGAVISGIRGRWRPGETPKNWEEIRASFWGPPRPGDPHGFLLGDYAHFARFCALAQGAELSRGNASEPASPEGLTQPSQGSIA